MRSKDYWEKRAAERMVDYTADAERTANTMGKAYQAVSAYLSDEAASVLKSFENAFDLPEAEARRLLENLPDDDMISQLKTAVGNISDPVKRKEAEALISSPAYAYRMDRLKELDGKTSEMCERLYNAEVNTDSKFFKSEVDKAYKRTVFDVQKGSGVSGAFDLIPQSRINEILKTNWSGEHFSKRVWGNTQALADGLKNDMLVGIMAGKSEDKMTEDIMNRCSVGAFEARRLVRTETTYISNKAELEGYKELDIEEYEFSACLDSRTSEICSKLDGRKFKLSEAKAGVNLPPMHPFCRSTTLPVLPDEEELDKELAELGDEIGEDVDFDEWVKNLQKAEDGKVKYVKPESQKEEKLLKYNSLYVDKSGKRDIIKSSKQFNPLPQAKVVNVLRKKSIEWIKKLTDKEKRAIRKYTKNSIDPKGMELFRRINAMLRGDINNDTTLKRYSDLISRAIAKFKLKNDIVCYRTLDFNPYIKYEVGDFVIEEQFTSTSVIEGRALKKPFIIKIKVPKGAKGAYIEELSSFPSQREFLIDKKSVFKVTAKGNNSIELELIR